MYEIARYFSDDARRYAASLAYLPTICGRRACVSQDGEDYDACPLGACCAYDHEIETDLFVPNADDVAWATIPDAINPRTDARHAAVYTAAEAFMADWDGGVITHLAAALGVS